MKAPDSLVLGYLQERDRAKVLMSCAAETIMLALSGRGLKSHTSRGTIWI